MNLIMEILALFEWGGGSKNFSVAKCFNANIQQVVTMIFYVIVKKCAPQ